MNEHESFFEELKREVDADHRRLDGASAPPASMWKSIRAQAQPETNKEETTMIHSNSIVSSPYSATGPIPKESGGFRHTLSLAASFLIVMSVALGGWFATMQLNQPGGSNGPFALFGQMDESATCEVEPLSVDRVMEIVKNPYPFMANGPLGEPVLPENPDNLWYTGLQEAEWWDQGLVVRGEKSTPADEAFENSSEFANNYLDCLLTGSVGQIWTFYSPIHIQAFVLAEFPVFANEDEVRANVEARIAGNADAEDAVFQWVKESLDRMGYARVAVNPDQDLALVQSAWGSYFESVVTLGVQVVDEDGKTTFLSSATGNVVIRGQDYSTSGLTISVGWDRLAERWYVLPYAPIST